MWLKVAFFNGDVFSRRVAMKMAVAAIFLGGKRTHRLVLKLSFTTIVEILAI